MAAHSIIVIGASAGGVEALQKLVHALPHDLPAAIFVVLHVSPETPSVLPQILSRAGPLSAMRPIDGQAIEPGRIYVAPPDFHLLIEDGVVRLTKGPRENGHRPAIDPLFRSASESHGGAVVGVILSGTLDDGTEGLMVIKRGGGIAVVQDPEEAAFPGMPLSAVEHVEVDYILPLSEIASQLSLLAGAPAKSKPDTAMNDDPLDQIPTGEPALTGLTCPECGGSLWELREGELIRYQCRVGHAYSPESLLSRKTESVEAALWSALNALEERAALLKRLALSWRGRQRDALAQRFESQADEVGGHATIIRDILDPEASLDIADRVVPSVAEADTKDVG